METMLMGQTLEIFQNRWILALLVQIEIKLKGIMVSRLLQSDSICLEHTGRNK
jgi:hypothetical protein